MPPCPHFDVKIIQRSKRQSAVASAAYQSGERLFSEYDQKQKYYSHKSEIVHTEIMLPPHAPPEYADRNTLWNAAEAIEKQWNSQLARRFVLAIPRELPPEQYADLIRDYCREFFVSKGMIADFAIHDKGDGNPHAHILLTMRAMDETGKWLPKSRKVYDLDENGERIRLASGRWKSHKEDTVDWNDQKYAEIWRQGWADTANRYLEAIGSPERLDLRSYARQGIDKIPTVHMGPAVSQLEKKGIQTNIGNLNRDIKAANSLMQSIRQMVRSLKGWLSGLKEKKAALLEALEQAKEPTIPELLSRYLDKRSEERTGWTSKGKLKGTVGDFNKVMESLDFLRQKEISTVESLDAYLDEASAQAVSIREEIRPMEKRVKEIDRLLFHIGNFEANKPVHAKYAAIRWKKPKEKYAADHKEELDAYNAALRYFKVHLDGAKSIDGKKVLVQADRAKTKSSLRTLPLVPPIRDRLLMLKGQQDTYRRLCGKSYNREYLGYLCVDEIGNIIRPNYVSEQFPKLLEKNGLRPIRFHDLRHSCASLLLANGVPMKQIQEWLGHSDFSTTANIYAHLDYASKLSSAQAMLEGLGYGNASA